MEIAHNDHTTYRTIKSSSTFTSIEEFINAAGPRPEGHWLSRPDHSKPYSAENICWRTPAEVRLESAPKVTLNGKTQSIRAHAEDAGIPTSRVRSRLSIGWTLEEALQGSQHKENKSRNKSRNEIEKLQKQKAKIEADTQLRLACIDARISALQTQKGNP